MARASVHQQLQLGVEAMGAPGVAVGANVILPYVDLSLGIRPDVTEWRGAGEKYVQATAVWREMVEGTLRGMPAYNDLLYLWACNLARPTTTRVGTTTAYRHVFELKGNAPDARGSLTVEQGNPSPYTGSVLAHRSQYGVIPELQLEFGRTAEPSLSGRFQGMPLELMTTAMTPAQRLDRVPVLPAEIEICCDSLLGEIGNTRLTDVSRLTFRSANMFAPWWSLQPIPGWSRLVDVQPELQIQLLMAANDQGMALLETMRKGDIKFLRFSAESSRFAGVGENYSLSVEMPGLITAVEPFANDEGVYAVGWTFAATPALVDGAPLKATLVNNVVAFA